MRTATRLGFGGWLKCETGNTLWPSARPTSRSATNSAEVVDVPTFCSIKKKGGEKKKRKKGRKERGRKKVVDVHALRRGELELQKLGRAS